MSSFKLPYEENGNLEDKHPDVFEHFSKSLRIIGCPIGGHNAAEPTKTAISLFTNRFGKRRDIGKNMAMIFSNVKYHISNSDAVYSGPWKNNKFGGGASISIPLDLNGASHLTSSTTTSCTVTTSSPTSAAVKAAASKPRSSLSNDTLAPDERRILNLVIILCLDTSKLCKIQTTNRYAAKTLVRIDHDLNLCAYIWEFLCKFGLEDDFEYLAHRFKS